MPRRSSSDDSPESEYVTPDLDQQIADAEAHLAALRAQKASTSVQEYPKMRYHATKDPVTVLDAQTEAEAAADGYTFDAPAPPPEVKS